MNKKYFILLVAIGLAVGVGDISVMGCGTASPKLLSNLARQAVSPDTNVSASAISSLRAWGPSGLQALLAANDTMLRRSETNDVRTWPSEQQADWQRLEAALTGVSGQRDCQAARLYWYTDFEQARRAAQASGKPILSLRLLGRLDEEYSCANSRFFRTTLYANTGVAQYLQDNFILHWKSVRPVPRITIDFGDGRKIDRTITGNSIHYILDADGRPIDALPGLYGPKAFLNGLAEARQAAVESAALKGEAKDKYLHEYHAMRYAALLKNWKQDLAAIGDSTTGSFNEADEATWARIGNLHADEAILDIGSTRLISFKNPPAAVAMRATFSKMAIESPLVREVANLQRSIAEDTVRNEYLFHSQLHRWLGGNSLRDVEKLNREVYAKLFLTPDSDPWLGLVPANTFSGLDNNGLVQNLPAH